MEDLELASYRDRLYKRFKKKHSEILKELSNNPKILYCANWWTGCETNVPNFMSANFDKVFDVAFTNGLTNSHPDQTRIEYWEVDELYPRLERIDYIGLEDK